MIQWNTLKKQRGQMTYPITSHHEPMPLHLADHFQLSALHLAELVTVQVDPPSTQAPQELQNNGWNWYHQSLGCNSPWFSWFCYGCYDWTSRGEDPQSSDFTTEIHHNRSAGPPPIFGGNLTRCEHGRDSAWSCPQLDQRCPVQL